MPPTVQVADALWQCLCPSFKRSSTILSANSIRNGIYRRVPRRNALQRPRRNNSTLAAQFQDASSIEPADEGRLTSRNYSQSISKISSADVSRFCHLKAVDGNKPWTERLVRELVEERGETPDKNQYTALIMANTDPKSGSAADVEMLLEEMEEAGIQPDSTVYHAVLKVLAIHPDYILRSRVIGELQRRWLPLTKDGHQWVIVGLLRDSQFELALDRLDEMRSNSFEPDPWLLNLTITALLSVEAFVEAMALLQFRATYPAPISSALWSEALSAGAQQLHHPLVHYVWRRAVTTSYLNPSDGSCILVLDTAARSGDFRLATDVFRILGQRSTPLTPYHYEALIDAYLASDELSAALGVLNIMSTSSMPPSDATCRSLYLYLRADPQRPKAATDALERQAQFYNSSNSNVISTQIASSTNASSPDDDLSTPLETYQAPRTAPAVPIPALNALLEAYIYQSNLHGALDAYKFLTALIPSLSSNSTNDPAHHLPTTTTFNTLLQGCAFAGFKTSALALAAEMRDLKIRPNALTYDRLILTFVSDNANSPEQVVKVESERVKGPREIEGEKVESATRDMDTAMAYYREMRRQGWWPRGGTFDGLVRRGWKLALSTEAGRVALFKPGKGAEGWRSKMEKLVSEWEGSGKPAERLREWMEEHEKLKRIERGMSERASKG